MLRTGWVRSTSDSGVCSRASTSWVAGSEFALCPESLEVIGLVLHESRVSKLRLWLDSSPARVSKSVSLNSAVLSVGSCFYAFSGCSPFTPPNPSSIPIPVLLRWRLGLGRWSNYNVISRSYFRARINMARPVYCFWREAGIIDDFLHFRFKEIQFPFPWILKVNGRSFTSKMCNAWRISIRYKTFNMSALSYLAQC